jgi:hypothetical protein
MIYARSDVCSITVGKAHGGCGEPHARGADDHVWGVACGACENYLRTDSSWSVRPDEIPESHDEARARESIEKNAGKRSLQLDASAAAVLALLTGSPAELLAGGLPQPVQGTLECRKCAAAVPPASRFCGSCGAVMLQEIGHVA